MASLQLSSKAYSRAMLHAMRYPAYPVSGLLVSAPGSGGENEAKGSAGGAVDAAVPLFHSNALAPLTETALAQAEAALGASGRRMVGWYVANERVGDASVPAIVHRAAEALARKARRAAVVVVVDNALIAHDDARPAVAAVHRCSDGGKWTVSKGAGGVVVEGADAVCSALREAAASGDLPAAADFEAHLEDPSIDWLALE